VTEEEPVGSSGPEAMEGIETNESEQAPNTEAQGDNEPATDRPRVMTVIRGNPFDITDLGIDAEFLSELPEEIREEVIMTAVAERRQQAAATGAQPSDIDQEFLDALPDDIRDEIIQQERQDRRRREREEQRRAQAPNAGAPPVARDMDVPSILATFPPALRQEILMDGDEELLASLPPDLAAQARSMRRAQPEHAGRAAAAVNRRAIPGEESRSAPQQPKPRRAIVQMLDKQGIATLLRLMFVFQHTSFRNTLNAVLQHVSLNKHNRAELISTLLHILQDGSADMNAIERSFSYLSLRAKQPKDKDPKTPQQTLRRTLTGLGTLAQMNSEASPLMVVQQCLTCLVYLAQHSPHVASFFLTEHEPAGGLKRSLSRKGKGKDSKAPRYALNSLLSLLDRELIMESANVMESLSLLLNIVTTPLIALERKQKEAAEEAEKAKEAAAKSAGESSGSAVPENTAVESSAPTNDQSSEQPLALPEGPTPPIADAPSTSSNAAHAPPPLIIPTNNSNVEEASAAPGEESAKPDAPTKEENKKPHSFTPPVIPEHNLRLVTNIFCCECNSKTFRETISTIKNLSTIPGAKAIFGKELISKAQSLGEVILMDLQELLPQIQKARTGTEIQGVALAKFSPPASDQHKLLRVLTALDHLFDPKREKKDETDTQGSSELMEKQDLLSSLYENSTFGPMWEKLSACLSAIRQRDHMLSVATILLPLIESLMVVCKNTTLKDVPITRSSKMKDSVLTSPAPESRMESLFFTFTEEHRKILNDLVRHTPKLMSGTFSLLVKNPKVLEFDNKRNYFSRSIHNRGQAGRSVPPLQLSVRREQVFHDSFKSLYFQTPDQMKYGKLSIRFHGEEGVDAGGVTREWFQVLSRQMFDPGYALFIPVSSDRTTFHPNQLSSVNEEHLMFFKFIGRIIGKALYEGRVLDCHFSRAVYKRILGKSVSVKDMESLDPDYYKSLVWMLENDITDIITETFSVDNDKFGVVETIDFIENGRNIPVTEENKHEYVRLMVEWKLTGSVKEQLDEFLKGKIFLTFKLVHVLTLF
jgi:E3 ubiquitin-protein ligase HUWE1